MSNNPLKQFMGNQMNNPVNNVLQAMNGGMNPETIFNQMVNSNPQAKQFISQLQQQANGRSPRELAMQYAKQKGISDRDFMQLLNRMGLK